jgi:hypothetical protein
VSVGRATGLQILKHVDASKVGLRHHHDRTTTFEHHFRLVIAGHVDCAVPIEIRQL